MTMENFAGPVIGAVIGYCTNYIAVKMLFYPRKEVKVCGHKVPFTPGAIPKGKPRLAKAIGNTIANTLLTEDDIRQKVLSAETEEAVINKIMEGLSAKLYTGIGKFCPTYEEYTAFKTDLAEKVTEQIMDSVEKSDLKYVIVTEAERVIKEKTAGTMLAMFLNDEMLGAFIQPVGDEVERYIAENGREFVQKEVEDKMTACLEQKSVMDLCREMNVEEEKIREILRSVYRTVLEKAVGGILKNINISMMVEEKINEMQTEELEKMVLTVMKNELDMIVNLGALVGGVLGTLNMFF